MEKTENFSKINELNVKKKKGTDNVQQSDSEVTHNFW